ncbi:MAG: hypothetical protein ACREJM_02370 [Candidatus Saccharimonadales bacterium]
MRGWMTTLITLVLASSNHFLVVCAAADDFDPTGRWVLISDWERSEELLLLDVVPDRDGFGGKMVDAMSGFGAITAKSIQFRDGHTKLSLHGEHIKDILFEGTLANDGSHAGEFMGTVQRRYLEPARLVRSTADKLGEPKPSQSQAQFKAAWDITDLHERIAQISEGVTGNPTPRWTGCGSMGNLSAVI